MRRLWIGCFAFTAVAFLLQVSPIPGIFLVFLMAAYWSVVTINLGFIFMAADGIVGSLPRLALVFPALWFVGYGLAAGASHLEARRLANEILAYNAGKNLHFNPQQESLFVESDDLRTPTSSAFDLKELIQNYALNSGYQRSGNNKCPGFQGVELRSAGCGQGAAITAKDVNGCPTITNSVAATDGRWRLLKGVCTAYTPVQPFQPAITVKRTAVRSIKNSQIEALIETFELRRSDGQTITLKAGHVAPIAWIPMPIVGCGPDPRTGWTCMALFALDDAMYLGAKREGKYLGGTAAVAEAMKLPAASVSARYPQPSG